MIKKISVLVGTIVLLAGCSSLPNHTKTLQTTSDTLTKVSTAANSATIVSKIANIAGIKQPASKDVWSGFFNNCVKNHVSTEKLVNLAVSGKPGITTFLNTYKAPENIKTAVYGKVVSCPEALPAAKKVLTAVPASSFTTVSNVLSALAKPA